MKIEILGLSIFPIIYGAIIEGYGYNVVCFVYFGVAAFGLLVSIYLE